MRCQFCQEEMGAFDISHACRQQFHVTARLVQQSAKPGYIVDISESNAVRLQERLRIIAILEEEIARAKSLIGLQDHKGQPFYDDGQMQVGIEVLEYLIERIQQDPEK